MNGHLIVNMNDSRKNTLFQMCTEHSSSVILKKKKKKFLNCIQWNYLAFQLIRHHYTADYPMSSKAISYIFSKASFLSGAEYT